MSQFQRNHVGPTTKVGASSNALAVRGPHEQQQHTRGLCTKENKVQIEGHCSSPDLHCSSKGQGGSGSEVGSTQSGGSLESCSMVRAIQGNVTTQKMMLGTVRVGSTRAERSASLHQGFCR